MTDAEKIENARQVLFKLGYTQHPELSQYVRDKYHHKYKISVAQIHKKYPCNLCRCRNRVGQVLVQSDLSGWFHIECLVAWHMANRGDGR